MASLRSARLRRRLAALTEAAANAVNRRRRLRDNARACAAIRGALAREKRQGRPIDERRIEVLRLVADAEEVLARLGDTAALQAADAAFIAAHPRLLPPTALAEAAESTDFAGRPPPDPGAALTDWYAWAVARLSE